MTWTTESEAQETEQFDLTDIVQRCVQKVTPPFQIEDLAPKVAEEIPDEHLRDVVIRLLPDYIRLFLHKTRRSNGRSRFDAHRANLGQADLPYRVEDGWKSLLQCTPDEIDYIAQKYEMRAEANGELAKRFRLLADTMRYAKASVMAELPADILDEFVEQLTGSVVDVANTDLNQVESA